VSEDTFVAGAWFEETTFDNSGVAYVFDIDRPVRGRRLLDPAGGFSGNLGAGPGK